MDTGLNDCRREAYREEVQKDADWLEAGFILCIGRHLFARKLFAGKCWDEQFLVSQKGWQGREITNIDIKKRGVLMCTAATYKTKDFYFGRTLDYEFSYGEEIVIMPRNYPIPFRFEETDRKHYAIIGTAHVADGYPMFYDAVNEKGLGMAGLNFVGNAVYRQEILPTESGTEKAAQAAQYEFITWILSRCANVSQWRGKSWKP